LIHWSIAFCCAVDPVALSLPDAQAAAALVVAASVLLALLDFLSAAFELEQADSTTAPAMSPTTAPARYSFTLGSPS
jgi:hypothetical protein